MVGRNMQELLADNPVIAAVKDWEGLEASLASECNIVFVLFGNLMQIAEITRKIREAGKLSMVHIDLVEGLSPKEAAIDFIRTATSADGIVSTKANLVRYAKSSGMLAVQRFFILDSLSLQTIYKQLPLSTADAIEVLPGIMPKILRELVEKTRIPIIAGGLISHKEDVIAALDAGAAAISSTSPAIWLL